MFKNAVDIVLYLNKVFANHHRTTVENVISFFKKNNLKTPITLVQTAIDSTSRTNKHF